MSDYISKSALLDIVGKMPLEWEYGKAVSDIYDIIEKQPTISETEIIRKAFERVVARLEEKKEYHRKKWNTNFEDEDYDSLFAYIEAIKIVKEECGISE